MFYLGERAGIDAFRKIGEASRTGRVTPTDRGGFGHGYPFANMAGRNRFQSWTETHA